MKNFRILIVEDNDAYRKLYRDTLEKPFPQITIDEAVDGRGALQKVNAVLPDLILMDIRLPDESGLELTKKIKATHPNIGIVILTNYDIPEYRKAASQCGADHFLDKGSFSSVELEDLVKSYLKTPRTLKDNLFPK